MQFFYSFLAIHIKKWYKLNEKANLGRFLIPCFYIGGNMTNIKMLEQALPAAPLKIAALKSCESLGKKVNDHIVGFRKES